jgi:hypothetical protein
LERERDREEIARLDRMGLTQRQIGQQLGLSQQLVCYDLRRIRDRYLKAQLVERRAKVAEKMEELRDIKAEAWRAWDESRGAGKPNLECLRTVLSCVQQERELLSLDSVRRVEDTQPALDWDALLRDVQNQRPDRIETLIVKAQDGQGAGDALVFAEVGRENRSGGATREASP